MKHTLSAKSSSGEPYDVTFEVISGRMTVRCSCKAGGMDQQCKHKRALASGDCEMLFDSSQDHILNDLIATVEGRELTANLKSEEAALVTIEREKSRLAAEEKSIKKRLGSLFLGGK